MRQNKINVAITGGIGSGKSTVAEIIKETGYPVFSCDETYAKLLRSSDFIKEIGEEFDGVVTEKGELDRAKLSSIVFNDKVMLEKLNRITHPAIYKEMFSMAENEDKNCFFEVPLLFEDNSEVLFDKIIVVLRDKAKRIDAVKRRDNLSDKQIKERIKSQIDYDNIDFAKYYVIHNNGDLYALKQRTKEILEVLK